MSPILTISLNPAIDLSSEAEAVHHTSKVRTVNERYDPGGGGINVARVITTLGANAEALFAAGGETGAMLDRLLKEEGISSRCVPIAGQTRISFMVRERSTGHEYRFVPKGPDVRADELQPCLDAVAGYEGRYVVAGGSLPGGAPADIYARMAELARKRGVPGSFSTVPATDCARRWRSRASIWSSRAWANLNNWSAPSSTKTASEPQLPALSSAARPNSLLPAVHVRERSAVGAGDSFLAAMTLALSQGKETEDAFRYGIAAGAAAVMTPGTELCRRNDVESLYRGLAALGSCTSGFPAKLLMSDEKEGET